MEAACAWLENHESAAGGWGWVSDVVPNPQNTAENVVALCAAGRATAPLSHLVDLLGTTDVSWPNGEVWSFETPLDWAWRIRGLARLPDEPGGDRDQRLAEAVEELTTRFTGRGWRMSPREPESPFVTATALISIAEAAPDSMNQFRKAWRWLLDVLRRPGDIDCPVAHTAWALLAVTELAFAPWRDTYYRQAVRVAHSRLVELTRESVPTEQEAFVRGQVRDVWRHPNTGVVLQAVLRVEPRRIFDPFVRRLFWELVESQHFAEGDKDFGAFALSSGGHTTTYATAQGIEAMVAVRTAVTNASPADILDVLCRVDGRHHTDAQEVLRLPGRTSAMLNSTAGLLCGALVTIPTVSFLAYMLSGSQIGDLGRKVVACLLSLFVAVGWYGFVAARLPQTPNRLVALGIYGVFTALLLPMITYFVT
jgi:hypothetical protein